MNTDFKTIEKLLSSNGWFLESRIGSYCIFVNKNDFDLIVTLDCSKETVFSYTVEFLENITGLSFKR